MYYLFLFLFYTHNMFWPLRAILKWDIQLVIISVFEGLFLIQLIVYLTWGWPVAAETCCEYKREIKRVNILNV
jgi:hypothetical protein